MTKAAHNAELFIFFFYIGKLDEVALLLADPLQRNSTTRQNQPLCNLPLYIAVTSEVII